MLDQLSILEFFYSSAKLHIDHHTWNTRARFPKLGRAKMLKYVARVARVGTATKGKASATGGASNSRNSCQAQLICYDF